jgi:uncharacterized protein YbjT (DUF2867 family)
VKIAVIGARGRIGRKLVHRLRAHDCKVVEASPTLGVDAVTGRGLTAALHGAAAVVDVSNPHARDGNAASRFFKASSHNLLAAGQAAGVRHHVALSVVGTDRLQDSGYFRAKLAQEETIKASPIPYTLVRATQFFEFLRQIAQGATVDGSVRLPAVKFQPIAADDVATAIVDRALGTPANDTIDIAGPETFTLDEPVRRVLAWDEDPRPVIVDPSAPYFEIQVDDKSLVPGGAAALGSTKLDWWLAKVPAPKK